MIVPMMLIIKKKSRHAHASFKLLSVFPTNRLVCSCRCGYMKRKECAYTQNYKKIIDDIAL